MKKLVKLVSPPDSPVESCSAGDWKAFKKELGTDLPSDYQEFIKLYGTGTLASFLFVYSPFAVDDGLNLTKQLGEHADNYNQLHEDDDDRYPYAMYPALPGLIPWGGDSNGNRYFWIAKKGAKPDSWKVTINEGGEGFQDFDGSFSGFIVALLQGNLDFSSVEFEKSELTFSPATSAAGPSLMAEMDAAIDNQDVKALRKLLKAGGDPNAVNEGGLPLICAAAGKSVELTHALLEAGADLSAVNEHGATAVFEAVYEGKDDVLRYLLERGADPNARKRNGETPLFAAITNGNLSAIGILAHIPATLTATNKGKQTPLAYAKSKQWTAAVEALTRAGAKK